MAIVYGDLFWLWNAVIDLILLSVAGRLAGCRAHPARLVLGASLGATYALGFLHPPLAVLYHPLMRVAALAGMLAAAFMPVSGRRFLGLILGFAAASALVAGAASALAGLASAGPWGEAARQGGVPVWSLVLGLGIVAAATRAAWSTLRRRWTREALHRPVEIALGGRRVTCTGLVDTGNHLEDPLTGAPVLVVELAAVKDLLPPEVAEIYANGRLVEGVAALSDSPWNARFRLLPFTTLGQPDGLFLGFRPDAVTVGEEGRRVAAGAVTVAVAPDRLSAAGEYQALIPPALSALADGEPAGAARSRRAG